MGEDEEGGYLSCYLWALSKYYRHKYFKKLKSVFAGARWFLVLMFGTLIKTNVAQNEMQIRNRDWQKSRPLYFHYVLPMPFAESIPLNKLN